VVEAPRWINLGEDFRKLKGTQGYYELGVSTDDLSLLLVESSWIHLHIVGSSFFT